jgi:hypothetical protein
MTFIRQKARDGCNPAYDFAEVGILATSKIVYAAWDTPDSGSNASTM